MVAVSVIGGLLGGPGWAKATLTATSRPVQTKRLFMGEILLDGEYRPTSRCSGSGDFSGLPGRL
jgi:hypothetical protein